MIKTQSLNIGGYDLKALPTGKFGLDGGAMFGTVPKVLWERTNPADDKNRIEMEARALLLVGHNRKILVDTGNGSDFTQKYGEKAGSKFAEMYAVDPSVGLVCELCDKRQVIPIEACRVGPVAGVVLVEAGERGVVAHAVFGLVFPDCGLDGAEPDLVCGFLFGCWFWHRKIIGCDC